MVTEKLESEVEEILKLISEGKNFLLSGGAGSGKTYSLVSLVNSLNYKNPKSKIACITYTNAAVNEIESRISNENVKVSTIHDFLWDCISSFQEDLKETLIEGINDENTKYKNIHVKTPYEREFREEIKYTEYVRLSEGKISHDQVIILANDMFCKYKKLCKIVSDKYDYIFVDEYQDTFKEVVNILLNYVSKCEKKSIIGFFGDSMQAIYDNGIGNLNEYKNEIKEVKKEQNRRNPQSVIDLANKLRMDDIIQEPSKDNNAPNMENGKIKKGTVKFLYGEENQKTKLKDNKCFDEWNFSDMKETKELRLTHNLIAREAGFSNLMNIYDKDPIIKLKKDFISHLNKVKKDIDESDTFHNVINSVEWNCSENSRKIKNRGRSRLEVFLEEEEHEKLYNRVKNKKFIVVKNMYWDKEQLISDKKEADEEKSTKSKRDSLIRHLFKIQNMVNLYENKEYNEFIRKTSFSIKSISDKQKLKNSVEQIVNSDKKTIGEIISYADESRLCLKDDILNKFIEENEYLYSRVSDLTYNEFVKLYNYLEGHQPFSTQHKIKGEEFKNVLIILDNGKWAKYNFEYLFDSTSNKKNILNRTKKLFYVCCTRAMENLVVYYEKPTNEILNMAQEWFGKENCIKIDE